MVLSGLIYGICRYLLVLSAALTGRKGTLLPAVWRIQRPLH